MTTTLVQRVTEVIATVRTPDGNSNGEIDGLVIRQQAPNGGWYVLSKQESIKWALGKLLWCKVPGDGRQVEIEAVDQDGDNYYDYVRSKPDHTRSNNLLALPIWDRARNVWRDRWGNVIGNGPV